MSEMTTVFERHGEDGRALGMDGEYRRFKSHPEVSTLVGLDPSARNLVASDVQWVTVPFGQEKLIPVDTLVYLHPDAPALAYHSDGTATYGDRTFDWHADVLLGHGEHVRCKLKRLFNPATIEAVRWRTLQGYQAAVAHRIALIQGFWNSGVRRIQALNEHGVCMVYELAEDRYFAGLSLTSERAKDRTVSVQDQERLDLIHATEVRLIRWGSRVRKVSAALEVALLGMLPDLSKSESLVSQSAEFRMNGRIYWMASARLDHQIGWAWHRHHWPETERLIFDLDS